MKYLFTCALIAITFAVMAAQKPGNQFILNGILQNQEHGWMYLSYVNAGGRNVKDSALITNGRFSFKGLINEPTRSDLRLKHDKHVAGDDMQLFLEPGLMTIRLEPGRFDYAVVKGSATQADQDKVQSRLIKINERWKVVIDTLMAIAQRDNFKFQELKDWVLVPYFAEQRDVYFAFIDAHPNSYLSANILAIEARETTTDSVKMIYNRFPERIRKSFFGKEVVTLIKARETGVPGTTAAAFSTKDINGQPLSLSDFKGKYVLLDFWASWCLPCRQLNPHLKELYTQYKQNGFEVIGIADDDDTRQAWEKAVADDGVPWRQILTNKKAMDGRSGISYPYNITEIPVQILIDPNGKIIGRYGDGGQPHEVLDKELDSVFAKTVK